VAKDKEKLNKKNMKEELEETLDEQDDLAEMLEESSEEVSDLVAEEAADDELSKVKSEAAEYLDGWQRARAEFANYKKRVERETEEARQRITSEIIFKYLGIMDDLERALENSPEDKDSQEWISGIELIYQKFTAILEAEGVERIEVEGERFDPNLHEAISYEETEEFEGGAIIAVTQRGYKLGDRIIRPAMVRVAK
jgi:molecular chaperone GrpE